MLTLITFPPKFGEPAASPFCVKAIYMLNGSKLPWDREDTNDPRKMPRAKLPVLRTDTNLIHGSDNICLYLTKHGHDLDRSLSTSDRAISQAMIRMTEEHLYFLLALDRWERDEIWPIVRDAYFHEIPSLIRPIVTGGLRRTMLKGMHMQGLGRLTWSERMERANQDFTALANQLGDKPYLFGDKPSNADAAIAPFLSGIMATPGKTDLSLRVREDIKLSSYSARVSRALGENNQ
ncbi:MAG: glutathione S-transferase family protein [Aliishimia sp.]